MATRAVLVLALLTLPGCFTFSGASKRVALAPVPGAPPQLRGSPGIGLATRIPLGAASPTQQGDGIAIPAFQPEVNGVFKFAEHAYGSFDLNFSLGGDARNARTDLPRVQADLTFGALIGGGYDFQITKGGGVNVSAEGGFNFVSVTTSIKGTSVGVSNVLLFAGRVAAAPYLELNAFRIFGGLVVSSDVWSQADGFATTCSSCTVTDTGRTETGALLMAGAGVRYQPVKMFSVGCELWVPLTTAGVQHPPQIMFALQVGSFDFSKSQRPPEPPPEPEAKPDFIPQPPPPLPPLHPERVPVPVPL